MSSANGPSSQDINEMRRLRAILNGTADNSPNTSMKTPLQEHKAQTGNPDVDVMADILRRFNTASGNVAGQLAEESINDSRLQEALETSVTKSGIVIGKWDVVSSLNESDSNKHKNFDVRNATTKQTAYKNLTLIEAAHAVIRYLNKGMPISDPKINAVLELEEIYHRNRNDATRFKQRYNRCVELKEKQAAFVFADRFQVARANALVAHDQIKSILESIR
jgi:hypothetical protein